MSNINNNFSTLLVLVIVFFSAVLRFYNINFSDYSGDEMTTFFISDPSISNAVTNERINATENTRGYYFILKLVFKLFGYNPDYGRYTTAIVGTAIPIFFFYLIKKETNAYFSFITTILVSFNIFLISESQEVRAQIFYCLSSIITIFFFQNLFRKKSFFNYSMFIFFGILTCWFQIFGLIIIFSIFIYSLFLYKKNHLFLYSSLLVIFFFSLLINYSLLINLLNIKYIAINYPEPDFYYDYFFKYFFGSRFTGRIIFSLYFLLLLLNLKKIYKNKGFIFFVTIMIISAYIFPLIYTYVKRPCLLPRYIIFVIPFIIFSIIYFISELNYKFKNLILFSVVILIISNTFYSIYNKKNQKLLRLNNYLTNNKFNNIKIHIYKNHVMTENYFLNYKSLIDKNIFIYVLKNFDSVDGIQYMITSEDLLNHIHLKYEILYKDPVNYLIKFN